MIHVRSIAADELGAFAALTSEAERVERLVTDAWADGTGRPEWTLLAHHDGRPVGRLVLLAEPMGGGVSELEFRIAAPWLDWSDASTDAATALLNSASEAARPHAPTVIERRLNLELHEDIDRWRAVLEANGFGLFQEKQGFVWTDAGELLPEPTRLQFSTLAEIGPDAFADAMAASIPGTLDRNDRYYVARCGPRPWAEEMAGFLKPEDAEAALVAREPDGTLAGYVAVAEFEPGLSTIVHIAVAPACRGRGYIDELLAMAHSATRTRGFKADLSDVDTLNAPMLAAMERNGHRGDARPWHVWAYRRAIE